MRSALFVAAATAAGVVASTVPAEAAIVPYCTVRLVATVSGASASCVSDWPNADGLVMRRFDFQVEAGTVRASLTCASSTKTVVVSAPLPGALEMTQPRFSSCTQSLTAVTAPAVATGVSTYFVTHV